MSNATETMQAEITTDSTPIPGSPVKVNRSRAEQSAADKATSAGVKENVRTLVDVLDRTKHKALVLKIATSAGVYGVNGWRIDAKVFDNAVHEFTQAMDNAKAAFQAVCDVQNQTGASLAAGEWGFDETTIKSMLAGIFGGLAIKPCVDRFKVANGMVKAK